MGDFGETKDQDWHMVPSRSASTSLTALLSALNDGSSLQSISYSYPLSSSLLPSALSLSLALCVEHPHH
eukprot:173641-Rhodomonas_salina.1